MQQDYGSIERRSFVEEEDENTFIPGPVDVKTFPNRWRKAPFLIVLLLVARISLVMLTSLDFRVGRVCFIFTATAE